ncbi:protein adenylyltransferase SelO [Alteribacillus iranensis]|uniref:Protein nucleotidyltransferase YdiU n=1 Tax=Alteribacillus iranensis TaxID=930128 RepID=A0A1I2D0J1_9BACI|nr:YdiU family protein [Alteribacillus iranensis]SFE74005.1 Uncharacterized conserved protein YdiU, UPF0061 family [Alteribacillus iranensis]
MTTNKERTWNLDNSYARLPELFYRKVKPVSVRSPEVVIFNEELAQTLGLDPSHLKSQAGIEVLAGNHVPEGGEPIAQAYAGHQFGHFTMLGDGRAVLLGEQVTPSNERYDIQLKGSGRTPFSRGGDGRAALGPMIREYLISEAMYHLGVPTTRSLSVATTGDTVIREDMLSGAVLTRVAASHLRFGTFEYAARWGEAEDVRTLADYAIDRHYAELKEKENRYLSLLEKVADQQASLIAKWQCIGFIHGVMNTDNMTISGETIDYGPCAFMDEYDPATVFSSIDKQGRYAYQNQPAIGQWNLARFAETLLPLIHEDQDQAIETAKEVLSKYADFYHQYWLEGMRRKLGLQQEQEQDKDLIVRLLELMKEHKADFTNTFRALTLGQPEDTAMHHTEEFKAWYKTWQERVEKENRTSSDVYETMRTSNPSVIPRNHRVEEALEAAVEEGDYSVFKQLMTVLSDPYAYSSEQEEYTQLPKPSNIPYVTYCGT